jgi:hypothetical protein
MFGLFRLWAFAALALLASNVDQAAAEQRLAQRPATTTVPVPVPVPQVTPQFNNPGPQIVIPPPGNPVQQLAPLGETSPQVYAVPVPEPKRVVGRSSHHRGAKHTRRGHKRPRS